jgi:hypothetical protein
MTRSRKARRGNRDGVLTLVSELSEPEDCACLPAAPTRD